MTRKIVFSLPLEAAHRPQIAALAVKHRLPTMYDTQNVEAGGPMSYGVSVIDSARHAATYVDKIFRQEARRSPGRAADEVRVHRQSKSRQTNRTNDTAECAGQSGSSDSRRTEAEIETVTE